MEENVVVCVRVKPSAGKENKGRSKKVVSLAKQNVRSNGPRRSSFLVNSLDQTMNEEAVFVALDKSSQKKFSFDRCFGEDYSNQQIFEELGIPVLENALSGINTSMFAYGQTGSGKTYSMMGSMRDAGFSPRLVNALLSRLNAERDLAHFSVHASYFEIYNEKVRDLWNPENTVTLRIRDGDATQGPYVQGLCTVPVETWEDVESLLEEGSMLRQTAKTQANANSSRSHAIFQLKIETTRKTKSKGLVKLMSTIHLVDLAGSERNKKTHTKDKALNEACNINKSLMSLGQVINALAEQQAFVPYRNSVLTWLLKESLGGNSRTIMLATVNATLDRVEETVSTLRYADRAKRIVNIAKVNEDETQVVIRQLHQEVDALKKRLQATSSSEVLALKEELAAEKALVEKERAGWEADKQRNMHELMEMQKCLAVIRKQSTSPREGDRLAVLEQELQEEKTHSRNTLLKAEKIHHEMKALLSQAQAEADSAKQTQEETLLAAMEDLHAFRIQACWRRHRNHVQETQLRGQAATLHSQDVQITRLVNDNAAMKIQSMRHYRSQRKLAKDARKVIQEREAVFLKQRKRVQGEIEVKTQEVRQLYEQQSAEERKKLAALQEERALLETHALDRERKWREREAEVRKQAQAGALEKEQQRELQWKQKEAAFKEKVESETQELKRKLRLLQEEKKSLTNGSKVQAQKEDEIQALKKEMKSKIQEQKVLEEAKLEAMREQIELLNGEIELGRAMTEREIEEQDKKLHELRELNEELQAQQRVSQAQYMTSFDSSQLSLNTSAHSLATRMYGHKQVPAFCVRVDVETFDEQTNSFSPVSTSCDTVRVGHTFDVKGPLYDLSKSRWSRVVIKVVDTDRVYR